MTIKKTLLTKFLTLIFLISFIYNNKIYLLIFILHYKRRVPWYSDKPYDKTKSQEGSTDWMGKIKDSVDIRELAIPGTHDSAASIFICPYYKLWWYNYQYQCHMWSIEDQLNSGIRYLDLRPAGDGILYHGDGQTQYTFRHVFEIFKNFLINHPTEGLFVRIQFQEKFYGDNIEECKKKVIYSVLDEFSEFLFKDNNVPTMGELRKKMFIFLDHLEYQNYLTWNKNDLIKLQDHYRLFGIRSSEIDKKKELVKEFMLNEEKEKLIINHCSAIGRGVLTTLKFVAYAVNAVPFFADKFRGIFAFDFPGEGLVNHVINKNKIFYK